VRALEIDAAESEIATKKPDAERLIQIARRKLQKLKVSTELCDDGRTLLGTLPDEGPPLVNPLSAKRLRGIRFRVEGHDHLHLIEPDALAGTPALEFYGHSSWGSLRRAIAELLQQRAKLVTELRDRLQKLGFEVEPGDALARVRAVLDVEMVGTVLVEADEEGVRLVYCKPVGGGAPASMGGRPLDLGEFGDPSDVELYLTPLAEKALRERKPVASAAPRPAAGKSPSVARRPRVVAQDATADHVSLAWLLDVLGPHFFFRDTLAISRNLNVSDRPGRFDLELKDRTNIAGRISVEGELRWQGALTPSQLGSLERAVANILQKVDEGTAPSVDVQAARAEASGLIPPVAGERWLMNVQVVEEGAQEVRYVGLNAQGGRQGAPRVLPRHAFDKVFPSCGGGYRMLVSIVAVTDTEVTYQRLNSDGDPAAAPRKVPLSIFLDTFVAEAAAY
jgi:hypothetical protein